MGRYDELKKYKGKYKIQTYEDSYDDAAKAYWKQNYKKPQTSPVASQSIESQRNIDRAAKQTLANQTAPDKQAAYENMSYDELKENAKSAKRDKNTAVAAYLANRLAGAFTGDKFVTANAEAAKQNYKTAKDNYTEIKSAFNERKKPEWENIQNNNQKSLSENAELNDLVKKAYDAKLLVESSDKNMQQRFSTGQTSIIQSYLDPASKQRNSAQSEYDSYIAEINKLGYDGPSLVDTYSRNFNKGTTEIITDATADFADKHPVLASGAHVALNAFQAPAMEDVVKTGLQAAITSDYIPIDTNSPTFAATNVRDSISGKVTGNIQQSVMDKTDSEGLANAAAFLYQTGLSMGDFASVAALPQPASLAIMGTSAAVSTAKDATERGISADKAALTSIAAGAAEIVFEKLSLENLKALQATGRSGAVNVIKDILKQSFTEGSEEVFTDIANAITDILINGDNSALKQQYQALLDSGFSENEALKNVAAAFGKQVGESFLGGAISGGVMGSAGVAIGNMRQISDYRSVGKDVKNSGIAQNVIDEGLASDPNSKGYSIARALKEKLSNMNIDENTQDVAYSMLSDRKLGQLQLANQHNASRENLTSMVSFEDNKVLEKAMSNIAEGKKLSHAQFEAIRGSDAAVASINSEYGTNFTKENLKKDIVDRLSVITSRTLYNPTDADVPFIRNRDNSYDIDAYSPNGNKVDITDISTENNNVFVKINDTVSVPLEKVVIHDENQKQLLSFAKYFPTDTAKSFVAGFEYNSNINVGDYTQGFKDIYSNVISNNDETRMTKQQAIFAGAKYNMSPEQSLLAYIAAENSSLKETDKTDVDRESVPYNAFNAVPSNAYNGTDENKKSKRFKSIAQEKQYKQSEYKTALESDTKGTTVIGTPKNSMQKAEIELLDSVARDKGFHVIVVDNVKDFTGADANAAAVNGKIVIGLDTQNGMLLPYAGHELFHILKQNKNSSAAAKELQAFIIDKLKNDPSYKYDERFNELQSAYKFNGTDAEITDNINEEMAANACFTVLSDEENFHSLVKQNQSLAQKVRDFFADFVNRIMDRLAKLANKNAEYRALQNNLSAQKKIVDMMNTALEQYQKNNTAENNSVKYALKPYSEKQIDNWSNSKNIIIYNSQSQLQQFIDDARNHQNLSKKMYFGIINDNTADFIYEQTGVDVHNYNAVLRADSILKIFDSHGNEIHEAMRGQRAIKDEDIILLPELFGEIDFAEYQGKYTKMHGNNDFINIRSSIEPTITIGLVVQDKQLDIRVHTMYATKKESNATAVNAEKQPLPLTPKTDSGNAFFNTTVSQNDTDVNNNSMQNNSKYSLRDSDGNELTKQQREYFKDSKARDENGNLLVVYHGTDAEFTVFDRTKSRANMDIQGIFFSPWEIDAQGYGTAVNKYYINIANPANEGTAYKALNKFKGHNNAGIKARELLISQGYDGVNNSDEEYIAFYPEQIKLIDNENPTDNEDIRFSLRENSKDVEKLLKENAYLQDANELLRQELQLTEGHKLNSKQIHSVANKLIENHGAYSIDKELLTERLSGLYNYMASAGSAVNYDYIWNSASDIGKFIVKDSAVRDTSFYDEYKGLKKRLRETAITVPKSVRDEVSAYANLNKIKVRVKGDISLDSFYTELSNDYPELFSADIINEADQLSRILEVYESIVPIYKDRLSQSGFTFEEYSSIVAAEIFERYFTVDAVPVKNKKEFEQIRLYYADSISDLKKYYRKRYNDRMRHFKKELYKADKRTEAVQRQLAHFNEVSINAKQNRDRILVKNKILNVKKDLTRRLLNPSEKAYVPQYLVEPTVDICNLITDSEMLDSYGKARSLNILNLFEKLRNSYAELEKEKNYDYKSEYDQQMDEKISALKNMLERTITPTRTSKYTYGELYECWEQAGLENMYNKIYNNILDTAISNGATKEDAEKRIKRELKYIEKTGGKRRYDAYEGGNVSQINQLSLYQLEDIYHIVRDIKNALVDATKQIGREESISNYEARKKAIFEINATEGIKNRAIGKYEFWTLNSMRFVNMITEYNHDAELFKQFKELELGQRKAYKIRCDMSKPFHELRSGTKSNRKDFDRFIRVKIDTGLVDVDGNPCMMTEAQIAQLYLTAKRKQGFYHITKGGFVVYDSDELIKGKKVAAKLNSQKVQNVSYDDIAALYYRLSDYGRQWVLSASFMFNKQSSKAINETSMVLKHRKIATAENYIPIAVNDYEKHSDIEGIKYDHTLEGSGTLKSVVENAGQSIVIEGLNKLVDNHIDFVSQYAGLAIPIRNFNKMYNGTIMQDAISNNSSSSLREALDRKWSTGKEVLATKIIENAIKDIQSPRNAERISKMYKLQSAWVRATLSGKIAVTLKQAASYPTAAAVLSGDSLNKAILKKEAWKDFNALCDEIDEHTGIHYIRREGMSIQEIAEMTKKENAFINKLPAGLNPMKWIQAMDCRTTATLWIASKIEIEKLYPDVKVNSEEYWQKVTDLYETVIEKTQPNYDVLHRAEIQKIPDANKQIFSMFKTQTLQNAGIIYESYNEYKTKYRIYAKNKTDENLMLKREAKKSFIKAMQSQLIASALLTGMTLVSKMITHKMDVYRDENDELTLGSVLLAAFKDMFAVLITDVLPIFGSEVFQIGSDVFESALSVAKGNDIKGAVYDLVSFPTVTAINDLYEDSWKLIKKCDGLYNDENSPMDVVDAFVEVLCGIGSAFGTPASGVKNIGYGFYHHCKDIANKEFGSFESGVDRKPKQNANRYGKYYTEGNSKKAKEILDEMLESKKAEYVADGETQTEAAKKAKSSVRSSFTSNYKKQYQKAFLKNDGAKRSAITKILSSTGLFVYENNRTLTDVIIDWEKEAQEEQNKKKK